MHSIFRHLIYGGATNRGTREKWAGLIAFSEKEKGKEEKERKLPEAPYGFVVSIFVLHV